MSEYRTIEAAMDALATASHDVVGDFGEEALNDGWNDIVRAIAADCSTDVRAELLRREGLS